MRFLTTETVQTPDSEIVLRALETALPEISDEVVRDGHQITLRGLGPSPRTRNPRDITILHVSSDHTTTVIKADVSFQASAFLGTTPQDSVVRSKLDYIFDQVRSQLSLEAQRDSVSEWVPHSGVFAPAIAPYVAEPPLRTPTEPTKWITAAFVAESAQTDVSVSPPSEPASVEPVGEAMPSIPESFSPAPIVESASIAPDPPAEIKLIEPLPVVEKILPTALQVDPVVNSSTESAKPRPERLMLQFSSSRQVHRTHVPALIVAIIALLLLFAVAAYYLLRPNLPDPTPTSLPAKMQPDSQRSRSPIFLSCAILPRNAFVADPGSIPSIGVTSPTYQ